MDLSSSSSSSYLASANNKTSVLSSHTLYYYNVDAILSELIRPVTPKHGNLARPRLVKPEPIRPHQLMMMNGSSNNGFQLEEEPLVLLNDRTEGARNPDPVRQQQQTTSPFSTTVNDDVDTCNNSYYDCGTTGHDLNMYTTGSSSGVGGIIRNTFNDGYYYHPTGTGISCSSSKRSRDDEDILYYKKSNSSSATNATAVTSSTTEEPEEEVATLVTPNPIQYYTSTQASSSSSITTAGSSSMTANSNDYNKEPQYVVYKNYNFNDDIHGKNDSRNIITTGYLDIDNGSNNNSWTTSAPSTTSVTYTIVKPIAMRPMDVIQHLNFADNNTQHPSFFCQKNLYADLMDDGSMQVCG